MQRAFISHASRDREFVEKELMSVLRRRGLSAWYSSDEIVGGDLWQRKLRQGLEASDLVILVVSQPAAESKWVRTEIALALQMHKRVIPLLLDGTPPDRVHAQLVLVQYIDVRENRRRAWRTLTKVLREKNRDWATATRKAEPSGFVEPGAKTGAETSSRTRHMIVGAAATIMLAGLTWYLWPESDLKRVKFLTLSNVPAGSPLQIKVTQSFQLQVELRDEDRSVVTGRSVTWKTHDSSLASVTASGMLMGRKEGETEVSARCEDGHARLQVRVLPRPRCKKIRILNEVASLHVGQTHRLRVKLKDEGGQELVGRDVEWKSSDAAIAHVNQEGVVEALRAGKANIIARCEDGTAQFNLGVRPPPPVEAVEILNGPTGAITEGVAHKLRSRVRLSSGDFAANRSVRWSSSNPAVADVDPSSGRVQPRAGGVTTIAAVCEGKRDEISIRVRAAVRSVLIHSRYNTTSPMYSGYSVVLRATVRDRSGTVLRGRSVRWSVDNPRNARIDASTGKLTTMQSGHVAVTATCEGRRTTHRIKIVRPPPPRISEVIIRADQITNWVIRFDRGGNVTSWTQKGALVLNLGGSGKATTSGDKRFDWQLDVAMNLMGVKQSFRYFADSRGRVYQQSMLGLHQVGTAKYHKKQ